MNKSTELTDTGREEEKEAERGKPVCEYTVILWETLPEYVKYLTSASLRFSGLTLTLLEMDSRTSAVLEFSLLTLTKN